MDDLKLLSINVLQEVKVLGLIADKDRKRQIVLELLLLRVCESRHQFWKSLLNVFIDCNVECRFIGDFHFRLEVIDQQLFELPKLSLIPCLFRLVDLYDVLDFLDCYISTEWTTCLLQFRPFCTWHFRLAICLYLIHTKF